MRKQASGTSEAHARPTTARVLAASLLALAMLPWTPPVAADHEYEQPVWFTWDHTDLDVLVLAPDDPWVGDAFQAAFDAWESGIEYWSPKLAKDLTLRYYWPARDSAEPPGFQADIAVVSQGFFAAQTSAAWGLPRCYAFAPMAAGWGTAYRVTSHEFGHCLGLGHVFEHGTEYEPGHDIMGGGSARDGKCPSNLNAMVLERVFAGETGTVVISIKKYQQSPGPCLGGIL